MKISKQRIEQLRMILLEEKALELTYEEAEQIGYSLINFIVLLSNQDKDGNTENKNI